MPCPCPRQTALPRCGGGLPPSKRSISLARAPAPTTDPLPVAAPASRPARCTRWRRGPRATWRRRAALRWRWRPGRPGNAPRCGSPRTWRWPRAARSTGRGWKTFGFEPEQLIRVAVAQERAVLWAMEEGLRCRGVGAVIGEIRAAAASASPRAAGWRSPPGARAARLSCCAPPRPCGRSPPPVAGSSARRPRRAMRRARAAAACRQSHAQPAGQPGIVDGGVEQCRAAFRARNGSPACGCGGFRPTGSRGGGSLIRARW